MARVFTEGAEMGDTLFWSSASGVTAVSASPTPHASAYCYKVTSTGCIINFSALSEFYIRFRVYFEYPYLVSTQTRFPGFFSGATWQAELSFDASGHVTANIGGSGVGTSSQIINANQWYLFELYYKMADSSGRLVLDIDAVNAIDYTGDTKPYSDTTIDRLQWRGGAWLGGSSYLAIDDMAFNDTTGGVDDSYPGDGIIIKVTPNGNGTTNDWHGSDGNDVDNYALVDEYPHDTDTSYVYHNGADSGTQDQYALSDYSGTDKTITRIYPEARIRKTAAAAHTVKLGTLASGGSDAMSAAMNLTTTYARYVGNEQTVNPVDSNPWEEADIDALELVVEVG